MKKPVIGIVGKPGYDDPADIWNRIDMVDENRIRYSCNWNMCWL